MVRRFYCEDRRPLSRLRPVCPAVPRTSTPSPPSTVHGDQRGASVGVERILTWPSSGDSPAGFCCSNSAFKAGQRAGERWWFVVGIVGEVVACGRACRRGGPCVEALADPGGDLGPCPKRSKVALLVPKMVSWCDFNSFEISF